MENTIVTERIARAHQQAALRFMDYMERFSTNGPDMKQAREYYCNCLRDEAFRNSKGEKEYDDDLLNQLIPALLREFQSEHLDMHMEEAIMEYHKTVMNRKILCRSAEAILSSKFGKKATGRYTIRAFSENEISIVWHKRYDDVSVSMNLENLIEKVQSATRIKDLFTE